VENDAYEVIPDRGMTPQLVHQPERGMGQRIVLLRGTNVEPNAPQTRRRFQFGRVR